eukprot:1093927-Pelagomonas_calceolata.AAC.3
MGATSRTPTCNADSLASEDTFTPPCVRSVSSVRASKAELKPLGLQYTSKNSTSLPAEASGSSELCVKRTGKHHTASENDTSIDEGTRSTLAHCVSTEMRVRLLATEYGGYGLVLTGGLFLGGKAGNTGHGAVLSRWTCEGALGALSRLGSACLLDYTAWLYLGVHKPRGNEKCMAYVYVCTHVELVNCAYAQCNWLSFGHTIMKGPAR